VLCAEIVAPEDSFSEMLERVDDYFRMGVQAVWVVDPRRRRAFAAGSGGYLYPVRDELTVEGTPVRVPVDEIFAELDQLQGKS
jgi:Uma2 family endonuclease